MKRTLIKAAHQCWIICTYPRSTIDLMRITSSLALWRPAYSRCCVRSAGPSTSTIFSDRRLIKFQKGENVSVCWTPLALEKGILWDITARSTKYLYALEDLGHGAHGRVWLACTQGGSVCVLKFSLGDSPDRALDVEKNAWGKVYGEVGIKVYREKWNGHAALRMLHFALVDPNNLGNALPLVRDTLEKHFHANGVKHNDVTWRNIGMFKAADGTDHAVVFDVGSTSSIKDENRWVDQAVHLFDK